jgi:hypothetical protein
MRHSASRFAVNEIALAYTRPFLDVATGIDTTEEGKLGDVGGRYTFTFPGSGCLLCAQAIDSEEATKEFSPPEVRATQERAGYIRRSAEPAPSVMPLNGLVASQAVFEVLVWATGIRPPHPQRIFDAMAGTVDCVTFAANPKCNSCGECLGKGDIANLAQKYSRWASKVPVSAAPSGVVGRILKSIGFKR